MQFASYQLAACFSHQLCLSKNLLYLWVQPAKGADSTPLDKPGFTPYGDFPGFDWFRAKVIVTPPWARLGCYCRRSGERTSSQQAKSASKLGAALYTRVFRAVFLTDVSAPDFHHPWLQQLSEKSLQKLPELRCKLSAWLLVLVAWAENGCWGDQRLSLARPPRGPAQPRSFHFEPFLG